MPTGVVLSPSAAATNVGDDLVDQAAVGSAQAIRKQVQRYRAAGATDLVLSQLRSDTTDPERIWEVAVSI